MGSGVWCGEIPLNKAHDTLEVGDPQGGRKSVKEELDRIDYLGETEANWQSGIQMGGHFELHLEQGPHLVSTKEKIGVVQGAQAYQWLTITIEGRDCHSGTTSFDHRTDALFNAARLMVTARSIARKYGGLATVGIIKAEPGSVNTVPGRVTMSMDMRHYSDDALTVMVDKLQNEAKRVIDMLHKNGAHPLKIRFGRSFHTIASMSSKDLLALKKLLGIHELLTCTT
jgi:acetylornithine deacetylase/succinyl-diaminopimelate desuccinylase-like protein